jgi:MFS family permease
LGLIAAGYADFPLIAYHFGKTGVLPPVWIPLFYAVAMGVDAVAALALGRLYDRWGLVVLLGAVAVTAWFAPLVFFGGFAVALAGVVLWGIGMGVQESVVKAVLAELVPPKRRATAFGIFHTGFGLCWFVGSALMGLLYDLNLWVLVAFSILLNLTALPFLVMVSRRLVPAHRQPA